METLTFDVMLNERFIKTFKYRYNPLSPINGNELSKLVEDKLPTLKKALQDSNIKQQTNKNGILI